MPGFEGFRSEGLGCRWQLIIFVAVAAAIFSRRPDALLNPQFYAEDGTVWYAQAYNFGWLHSLTLPEGGYLNTFPRVVAGLSLLVPFKSAPLLMNWFGIGFQVLPVTVLLSSRCSAWAPLPVRLLQALIYVALPNSREIDVVLTNAQWHLALVACILIFARPPMTWIWKVFDVIVFTLCGLTGPFCLLMVPFAAFFWWKKRQTWSRTVIAILGTSALIQVAELVFHPGRPARLVANLGANPLLFCRLLAGQVFTAAIIGENKQALHAQAFECVTIAAIGVAVLIYCCYRCTLELRLFVIFSMMLFCASLKSPLINGPVSQWQLLADDSGGRYWFFPMLAFLWCLIWLGTQRERKLVRAGFILLLLGTLEAVRTDWRYPAFDDLHFGTYARQFESAAPGTNFVIPIYPVRWTMQLVKKSADQARGL